MAHDEPRLLPWKGVAAAVTFSGGVYFSPRLQNTRTRGPATRLPSRSGNASLPPSLSLGGGIFGPFQNSTTWTCSRVPAIRLPYCGRHASPPPSLSPVGVFLAPAKDSMLQARTRGHATRPASRSRHASSPPSLSPVGVFLAPSKDSMLQIRTRGHATRPASRGRCASSPPALSLMGGPAGRALGGVTRARMAHTALPAAARCSPDSTLSVIARVGRGRQSARTECTHAARVPLWCEFGPNIARAAALHEKDRRHGRDGPVPTRCAPAQCSHGAPADAAGNAAAVLCVRRTAGALLGLRTKRTPSARPTACAQSVPRVESRENTWPRARPTSSRECGSSSTEWVAVVTLSRHAAHSRRPTRRPAARRGLVLVRSAPWRGGSRRPVGYF
ncbi:hypothetical protein C8J57DRAFT_1530845 [Mycena rebaudengoi]|nr:hypothetical protein C8J57DRAFT_1530845 [Mycena rebaudengoi]